MATLVGVCVGMYGLSCSVCHHQRIRVYARTASIKIGRERLTYSIHFLFALQNELFAKSICCTPGVFGRPNFPVATITHQEFRGIA